MADARWTDVDAELDGAIDHFRKAIELFNQNHFEQPELEGYKSRMAFMHACMQCNQDTPHSRRV